jgi:hypothetical protein
MGDAFAPRCKTTAIGSLPLTGPAEACRFVLDAGIDIPFWPQLPRRGFRELMNPMYSEGMPCLRLDEVEKKIWFQIGDDAASQLEGFYAKFLEEKPVNFRISPEYAAGFHAFLAALKSSGKTYDILKGHVTGPLTFALGTNAAGPGKDDLRASYYDEQLRDAIIKALTQKALWQVEQLRPYARRVIIFVDEPVLAGFGTSAYLSLTAADVQRDLNEMIDALHAKDALVGIHCCGNTDWAMLEGTRVDIISFDAYGYARSISLYPKEVQAYLDRGGVLAWGVVPTNEDIREETLESLKKRLMDGFALLEAKGLKRETLIAQSLITPSCGTGSLSVAEAEKVFDLLVKLGRAMQT